MRPRAAIGFWVALALAVPTVLTSAGASAQPIERVPAPTAPTSVLVHIDAAEPVRLQTRMDPGEEWANVCTSPCDQPVALDAEYRIAGTDSIRASKGFHLQVHQNATERLLLRVDPRHQSGVSGGTALGVLGAVMVLGGLAAIVLSGLGNLFCSDHPDPNSWFNNKPCDHTGEVAGDILVGAGVIAVFSGITIAALNAESGVTGDVKRPPPPPAIWAFDIGPRGVVLKF